GSDCFVPPPPPPPPPLACDTARRCPGPPAAELTAAETEAEAEAEAEAVEGGNGKTAGPRADVTRDTAVVQGRELPPPKSCEDEEDISRRRRRPSGKADDGLE
ncbi:unnamed protein product, partial [Laminaria digitata]